MVNKNNDKHFLEIIKKQRKFSNHISTNDVIKLSSESLQRKNYIEPMNLKHKLINRNY